MGQWKQLFASELASALQSLLDLTVDQMTDRLEVRRVGCGSTLVTLFVAAGDPSVEVLSEGIAGLAWLAQQELAPIHGAACCNWPRGRSFAICVLHHNVRVLSEGKGL